MKVKHYLSKELSIFEHKGKAACGVYVNQKVFSEDKVTTNRKGVTCKRCLASHIYKKTKHQQLCPKCNRIVGCDLNGRKRRCNCGK